MSPGFEYSDFKLSDKRELAESFPQHKEIINRLSHQTVSTAMEVIDADLYNQIPEK